MSDNVNKPLAGRVAIVTGGTRGLGVSIATGLARQGARVVVTGTKEAAAEKAAAQIAKAAGAGGADSVLGVGADVTKQAEIEALLKRASEWGGAKDGAIHILVNNAGVSGTPAPLELRDDVEEEFNHVFGVNVLGLLRVTRAAIPLLRKAEQGTARVINISSVAGGGGVPAVAIYAASKAAVISVTKTLALELAPAVSVNVVSPGPFATDMLHSFPKEAQDGFIAAVPAGRAGNPAELEGVVQLLAGPQGSYISGAEIPVDGAMSARF